MTTLHISLSEMQPYIEAAFLLDTDLLKYYDRNEKVSTTQDCCDNVMKKLEHNYPECACVAILENDVPVGYYTYEKGVLVSFGLNKSFRNSVYLKEFWNEIKKSFIGEFICLLNSCNIRGIEWLKKCGMETVFPNITILRCNQ